ncbi:MarR family winged helix-turn-helix transcriptional regulator [Lentzea sp. NPDC006480]|uniref:MarR family winged helix-turn-helix transcriptional regulator n=1 Tax=Lentzea sp. NPDC006480 TaxID=3157176 RepID=UPI0033A7C313
MRKAVPGDRRARAVEITPAGLALFDEGHVAAKPLSDRLGGVLDAEEHDQLTALLTKFAHPDDAQPS